MPKLNRVTQKILGGTASNNGQFGSAQVGTKVTSADIAVIMALAAWPQGWASATVSGLNLPTLEEIQGVDFVVTSQLSYLLERGIPEYDAGTTYFQFAVVMKPATFDVYGSIADDNTGNALSDVTKWKLLTTLGSPNLSVTGTTNITGKISPTQLAANTNNWNPTGLSTATTIRLSTDASRDLTGILAGTDGRLLLLQNIGAFPLVLKHDVTSTSANRILCPNSVDLTLNQNASVWLSYDATSSRWRVVSI